MFLFFLRKKFLRDQHRDQLSGVIFFGPTTKEHNGPRGVPLSALFVAKKNGKTTVAVSTFFVISATAL